jgi:hypothetical protein
MEDRNDLPVGRLSRYGADMSALLKWIAAGLVAGILWLVGMYTEEYFRPYKQIRTGQRKK